LGRRSESDTREGGATERTPREGDSKGRKLAERTIRTVVRQRWAARRELREESAQKPKKGEGNVHTRRPYIISLFINSDNALTYPYYRFKWLEST
jgi:hypothetical protein